MELKKKWNVRSAPNRLSDNQMKNVVAGYGDSDDYGGGGYGDYAPGTCGWGQKTHTGPFGPEGARCCGISKSFALYLYEQNAGSNWCCDSCSTTWYCPGT